MLATVSVVLEYSACLHKASCDPMIVKKESILLAIRNIAKYGDNDVFPFPLENHWFHDSEESIAKLLEAIDGNFQKWIDEYPVDSVKSLAGVGYNGFRLATQIDPIWNAYLLALLIEVGVDVEVARVSSDIAFAYRYRPDPDSATLFHPDFGWKKFQEAALVSAQSCEFVLATDISDFYSRVYHHRLENALNLASKNKQAAKRIIVILTKIASGASYGLPVGGNAARMLAELLLNRVDRLLLVGAVRFLRFVDDYYIFSDSRENAQSSLVFLSEALLHNEGLSLSKAKTRFMSRAEFLRSSPLAEPGAAESESESETRRFLKLRLAYDPYSATADDDYIKLSEELEKFDIIEMLAREFRKSRVDEAVVRQLIRSIRFLSPDTRERAVSLLLSNMAGLYPVFPTVVILLKSVWDDLSEPSRTETVKVIRGLLKEQSHIVRVPANLAFAIRLLGYDPADDIEVLLIDIYKNSNNIMIKRDVILVMARRRAAYWLSDMLKRFWGLSLWERRALIVASYVLSDEGAHWRKRIVSQLSEVDKEFMHWIGERNSGRVWEVPL